MDSEDTQMLLEMEERNLGLYRRVNLRHATVPGILRHATVWRYPPTLRSNTIFGSPLSTWSFCKCPERYDVNNHGNVSLALDGDQSGSWSAPDALDKKFRSGELFKKLLNIAHFWKLLVTDRKTMHRVVDLTVHDELPKTRSDEDKWIWISLHTAERCF